MQTRKFGITGLALITTACSGYLPNEPRFDSAVLLAKSYEVGKDGRIDKARTTVQTTRHDGVRTPVPETCSAADSSGASKSDRDACIHDLEADIDVAFHNYELKLETDVGKSNAFLDFGGIALSTASTAAGSATAKTILSAIGTGLGGFKSAVSDDYLYKSTIQALHLQMIGDRAKIATRIENGIKADISAYDMHSAYRDLIEYYYAGTLLGALQSVNTDAGAKAAQCTAAAQSASAAATGASTKAATADGTSSTSSTGCETVSYVYNYGDSGAALQKIWEPDGKSYDKKAETKLKACMTKLQVAGSVTELVFGRSDVDKNRVLGCYAST